MKIQNFVKHPLFSGSVIMVGGSLIANAINYLYHLLFGRILGPVNYGVLASIFSILYIISVVPASASFAIVKFVSTAENQKKQRETYLGIKNFIDKASLVLFVVLLISTPFIAEFLHIDNLLMVALVAPITFINLITLMNQATAQGMLKFLGQVGPTVISSVFKLTFGLILVYLGFSVLGAIFGVFLSIVLAYLYSRNFVRQFGNHKAKADFNLKPFLKYALPVLLQSFAFTSLFTMDVILVKHFLSPFEAGIYAALSTLGKIIYFAVQPITATMFPIVTTRRAHGEAYRNIFFLAFAGTIAVSSLVVIFYWLFPGLAIGILYGKEYLSASNDLIWMGIFMLFYTLSYNLANFLISIDKIKIILLPVAAALIQIAALSIWHGSILQVIQVSLALMIGLFTVLTLYLGYKYKYGK